MYVLLGSSMVLSYGCECRCKYVEGISRGIRVRTVKQEVPLIAVGPVDK